MQTVLTLEDGSALDLSLWPLPKGVEDGVLNRAQLARAFQVSENTITKWISQGMPALSQGQNGVAYEFQLAHCYAWKMARDEKARAERLRGDHLAQQAALAFRNLDDDQEAEEAGLTADEMRKWAEAEYHRNRVAEQRGDLVRSDRVRTVMEDAIMVVAASLEALPDWLELEMSLTPVQVQAVQTHIDHIRVEMRAELEKVTRGTGQVVAFGETQQGQLAI